MKRILLSIVLALASVSQLFAEVPPANVVRVFVEDKGDEMSAGTGSLVRPDLIITNNHVVQDRAKSGVIRILFPDWSVYEATVVKTNKRWDLAALKIEPVMTPPLELGTNPSLKDEVTVSGYGPGWYESDDGAVVGFYAPDSSSPGDLLRVHAEVRNGDSGGPITKNGKLVGVLFGYSDDTYGANINQIRRFLADVE